ncbi:MAG TPA: hypothetical protein VF284_10825 [Rhodanobacteraceae bacterium]
MPYWSADVGTNPASAMWQKARQFQTDYARYGVTDNFIKVALYKHHDWRSATQNAAVVKHFAHAAALARYAGFKGIAIDLEPYTPTWGSSADVGALDATVKQEGRAIAEAMHGAYPDMTLFVLPDVLSEIHHHQRNLMQRLASTYHQLRTGATASKEGYALAPAFLHGLLSVPWKHVVIGMEQTYSRNADGIAASVSPDYQRYAAFLAQDGESDAALSMAPGLWPLGPNSHSRAARETPERFAERLRVSMSLATRYVWIYGKGGTWWANAPTIAAPMAPNFPQFVAAIHAVRATCKRSGPIAAPRPDRH